MSDACCVPGTLTFAKHFDIVSRTKLLARWYSYGIRGTVLLWIFSQSVGLHTKLKLNVLCQK